MSRIFLVLASVAIVLMIVNLFLGLAIGDLHEAARRRVAAVRKTEAVRVEHRNRVTPELAVSQADQQKVMNETKPTMERSMWHKLLGIAAAIVAVLVNCISVTYFIGTSRWCKEVVDTYQLDQQYAAESARLKRQTFPWSLGGMLSVVGLIALGAASDPANNLTNSTSWSTFHFLAAFLVVGFLCLAYYTQMGQMTANHQIINTLMDEVRRVRTARGLSVEEATV